MKTRAATPPAALPTTTAVSSGVETLSSTCDVGMAEGVYRALDVVTLDRCIKEGNATVVEPKLSVDMGKMVDGTEKDIDEAFKP